MNNKLITSVQNPMIKMISQLQKKKSARKKQGLFIVEGIRAVNEIPEAAQIEYYVTTPEVTEKEVPNLGRSKWLVVPENIYKTISETESPQGAMAIVKMPNVTLESLDMSQKGFYLLLENIQDPGNLGTMIRTAHAFGAKAVLLTKGCVDLYSPKVVRSTMSSLFHVPVIMEEEVTTYIEALKAAGIKLYATHLSQQSVPIHQIQFEAKSAIIIGNEGNGISEEMKAATDCHMIIPMPGGAESLNASVATSICLYEAMRQAQ